MTKHWLIAVCSAAIIICLFEDVQGANQCAFQCNARCKAKRNNRPIRPIVSSCSQKCAQFAQRCTSCLGPNKCRKCAPGYQLSSALRCEPTSSFLHCGTNNGGCSARATCSKASGVVNCTCKAGFTGNGYRCTDIDECAFGQNYGGCSTEATCTNTIGSFTCTCRTGYVAVGKACVGWTAKTQHGETVYVDASGLVKAATSPPVGAQTSFLLLPCLAPDVLAAEPSARCVSLQPEFSSGYYLRHANSLLSSDSLASATGPINADASFIMHQDQWQTGNVAFQSVNFPQYYVHAQTTDNTQMRVDSYDITFPQYASFQVAPRTVS